MVNGLAGMRMDRRVQKELTRMGNKTGNGLGGMRMERRGMKEFTRMGNQTGNGLTGTNTEIRNNLTVFELGVITK